MKTNIGLIHGMKREGDELRLNGVTLAFVADRDKGICTIAIDKDSDTRLGYLGVALNAQDLRDIASAFMAMSERVDGPGKVEHSGD